VTTSNVHPLLPCALSVNLGYAAFLGMDGLRSVIGFNTRANIPRSNLKHWPDETSTYPVAKNYTSVIEQERIMMMIAFIITLGEIM